MADEKGSLRDISEFLQTHWFKKNGLITALVVTVFAEIALFANAGVPWLTTVLIVLSSGAAISFGWWKSWQPPRTGKDKIGFLIGISCSDDFEARKLREDFVIPLRKLIKSGRTGDAFHFLELPQHISATVIDQDDAQAMRVKARAHFMIYGQVRVRPIDGKDHHVIDLEGIVAHKPVPDYVSESLAREFTELLPRRVQLPTDNDLLSFQFTSEWADIVAKYIIGIAAAVSGDLGYAERLYSEASSRLTGKDIGFHAYSKLAQRIPLRVSELYEARARAAYDQWVTDRDARQISQLGELLAHVEESRKSSPMILNLLAIHKFLSEYDAEAALELLRKSPNTDVAVWHYNVAFLNAYKGDLKSAIRSYRQGTQFELDPDGIAQIEEFMCWVLRQQPEKYQLQYCLGFFNWKVKGDLLQAKNDFMSFLARCERDTFQKERELTEKWLQTELAAA